MKKIYSKPNLEIEVYEMSANIAANCQTVIELGPEGPGVSICEDFKGGFDGEFDEWSSFSLKKSGGNPFYEDPASGCDCYYNAGGEGYFTS